MHNLVTNIKEFTAVSLKAAILFLTVIVIDFILLSRTMFKKRLKSDSHYVTLITRRQLFSRQEYKLVAVCPRARGLVHVELRSGGLQLREDVLVTQ